MTCNTNTDARQPVVTSHVNELKEVLEKTLAWFDCGWNGVGNPPIAEIEIILSKVNRNF